MRHAHSRAVLIAATAALALGLAACGSDSEASDVDPIAAGDPAVEQVAEEGGGSGSQIDAGSGGDAGAGADAGSGVDAGRGDYAFGADREMMAEAILSAFPEDSEATWEGDTLVLTLDGDANAMNAGFSECMAVSHLIKEGDSAAIVFPNGRLECADILDDI